MTNIIGVALLLVLSCSSALAYDFPGKGSAAEWSDALPYYNRGNRYLHEQRYSDAVKDYRQAISRYAYDQDFFINLGVALRKLKEYPAAEQALKQALQLNNKDWSAWSDLGNVYLKENRVQDTIVCFEQALKCDPPAIQKAAIQGDIADIHHVLKNLGAEPMASAQHISSKASPKNVKKKNAPHAKSSKSTSPQPVPQQLEKDWGYQ